MVDFGNPVEIGGLISIVLFFPLVIVSCWRLVKAYLGRYDKEHRFYLHKLIFHTVFIVYGLFETLYAVSLIIHGEISRWGYSIHIVALFLNLFLFLMLINVWGIVLEDHRKTRTAATFLATVNLLSITWAIVDIHYSHGIEDFISRPAYFSMLCANALAKIALCGLIIIYGAQLHQSLKTAPTLVDAISEEENRLKRVMLRRITVVLSVFTFCYLCRVFVLIVLIISDNAEGAGTGHLLSMPLLVWHLVSWWIPNVLPNIVFLAMMNIPYNTLQQRRSDGVVNKMFANYDTERDSTPSIESFQDFSEFERSSRMTSVDNSRLPSGEVQMSRIDSQDVRVSARHDGWTLM